jgi:sporulation integral membrane protein YtvI
LILDFKIGGGLLFKFIDFNNKYIKTMILIIFFALTVLSGDYLIKTLGVVIGNVLIWFLPFIIALFLSYMLEPIIKKLEKILDRKISSLLILLIINVIIIGLLAFGISLLTDEIMDLQGRMSVFTHYIQQKYVFFQDGATKLYINLPVPVSQFIKTNYDKLVLSIPEYLSKSIYLIKVVPYTFKTIAVWFISCFISYLVLRDREKLNIFFKNTMSNSWTDDLKIINTQIIKAVMGFIKSQIIIIFSMFLVSLIALMLIGSDYFFIISILAGLFSIIPVIGTGIAYIPFILIKFSIGDVNLGIKLVIVYIITIIVREILVVKVVSQSVGLDLLSTIISMYVGIEIFGGFGFIIGPLVLIIIKVILKSSVMDRFRKKFNIL